MVVGIILMILQCVSRFIKDASKVMGVDMLKTYGDVLP
jgi:hypothetical protein